MKIAQFVSSPSFTFIGQFNSINISTGEGNMKTNVSQIHVSFPVVAMLVLFAGILSTGVRAEDWIASAAKTIEAAIDDEKNNAPLAKAILDQTHPTGKNPVIASVETSRGINGNSLSVAIKLN
jgi:hypothetical protein